MTARVYRFPVKAGTVVIPIEYEDWIVELCAMVQEWDGDGRPIEGYRETVEREIVRRGIESMRSQYI